MTGTATAAVAEFVAAARYGEIPALAIERAKLAYLDTIGVMFASVSERGSGPAAVLDFVEACGGVPESTIIGSTHRAPAQSAALVNGTHAHYLDYDDLCATGFAHPSCTLVPCVLALGEKLGTTGPDALLAYVVGWEVAARVGSWFGDALLANGWHTVGTTGTIAAAAAAAKLLGCGEEAVRRALGIAGSLAGGLKVNGGTDTKPLHAGLAAANGILAAELASLGVSATYRVLDGPRSLGSLLSGDAYAPRGDPTDRWDLADVGPTIKLHACGLPFHPIIDAALEVRRRHPGRLDKIERIELYVPGLLAGPLSIDEPESALDGKFSARYVVAAALVSGGAGPAQFSDDAVQRPRVRELMALTRVCGSDRNTSAAALTDPSRIVVRFRDGAVAAVETSVGQNSATAEEVVAKFHRCTTPFLDAGARADLVALVERFEGSKVEALASALARPPRQPHMSARDLCPFG